MDTYESLSNLLLNRGEHFNEGLDSIVLKRLISVFHWWGNTWGGVRGFDVSFLLFGILVDTYRPAILQLFVSEYHA